MKNLLMIIALVLLLATPAVAAQTRTYSWEDCHCTILGYYGNLVDDTNVSGPQTGSQGSTLPDYTCPGAHCGTCYLHVAEDPHYGTPQAYIAYIENLVPGDTVVASFYGYDITASGSPSLRIWAHYAFNGDVTSYDGSASGNSEYTDGTGWDDVAWEWVIPDLKEALVIEARLYSTPSTSDPDHTDYWIDDVCVTAPDHATISVPGDFPTGTDATTWGRIKTLFR